MNVYKILAQFLLILLLLLVNSRLFADWQPCEGIFGGTVNTVISSGEYIYTGTAHNGVYISTNMGQNWIQSGLYDKWIISFAVSGNNVLAGTIVNGVYLSTDNGFNWIQTSMNNLQVNALIVTGNALYAGVENFPAGSGGIWKSTDNGLNWVQITLNNNSVLSLLASGEEIYAGVESYPYGSGGVWKSTDNGQSWIQTTLTIYNIKSLGVYGNTLFAGELDYNNSGIWISSNNGQNWTQTLDVASYSFRSIGTKIFAATDFGLYTSSNNGVNWSRSALTDNSLTSLEIYGNKVLAASLVFGLYMSSDTGQNWNLIGINNQDVSSLTKSGDTLYAGTGNFSYGSGVFKSVNLGLRWNQTSLNNHEIYSIGVSGNNIIAGTRSSGLFVSTNSGQSWPIWTGANHTVSAVASSGSSVFAGTYGCYRSLNNGISWSFFSMGVDVISLVISGNFVIAGTSLNGLYISSNNGQNWIQNGLSGKSVFALTSAGQNIYAGTGAYGLYKTTNNGQNWIQTGLHVTVNAIAVYGSNIITGGGDRYNPPGIFISSNNGLNWVAANQGFKIIPTVTSLLIANNYIYAGTIGQSVWRRPLQEVIGVSEISTEIPSGFSLYQNYPNPFNPLTKIRFDVAENGKWNRENGMVTLKVYDILGKEVATLVNERLQPGTYEATWDASGFGSGVFFYRLAYGNNVIETRKMVLLK